MYAFFEGEDVTRFCTPKLLEISMNSGTFTVGETVTGRMNRTGLDQDIGNTQASITFRVAQSNHREGPYDVPTATLERILTTIHRYQEHTLQLRKS